MLEDDEYEHDSVYEPHIPYINDINIKSECPDYDDYDETYYEDEEQHTNNTLYSFRPNETVTVDVVVSGNNDATQCISTNHIEDIPITPVIIIIILLFKYCELL